MALNAAERAARARLGGYGRAANHDPTELAHAGQAGLMASLRRKVIEAAAERGEQLGEAEIERRLEARRQLHFAKMRFAALRTRARRKVPQEAVE